MTRTTGVAKRHGLQAGARSTICALAAIAAVAVAGCGGASKPIAPTTPLPTPAAATKFNNYIGTQGAQNLAFTGVVPQGGLYTLSLDDTAGKFTWQNTTNGFYAGASPGTLGGTFAASGGFLGLTTVSFGALPSPPFNVNPEYALEIPGRAALLRAGDDTIPPAFLVPSLTAASATCQPVDSAATFQFVTLPDPTDALTETPTFAEQLGGPAYGIVVVTSKGASYSFSNYNTFYLGGSSTKPASLQGGLCAQTAAGAAVTIPADKPNNIPPTTVAIGPTGFLMIDQTQGQQGNEALSQFGRPGSVGVIQPSSPLDVGSLTSGKYLGFKFEPAQEPNENPGQGVIIPLTMPVAFGVTAGPSGSLVGGVYPNDDPTQTPLADTTITFGTQAAKNNGLFPLATVTVPDPGGVCAATGQGTVGADAQGNVTCSFPAVVVAGNPEDKLALFLVANDFVNRSAMGIYLFQQ